MGLASIFDRLFGRSGDSDNAANAAKDRLRLVLMHDRTDIPATMMEAIRAEMIDVLTKYVDIDQTALEVQLEKEQGAIGLVLNIPIRRVKNEDEAAEAVAEAQRLIALKAQLQSDARGASNTESLNDAPMNAAQESSPDGLSAAVWPTMVLDDASQAGCERTSADQDSSIRTGTEGTTPGGLVKQFAEAENQAIPDHKTRTK